MPALHEWIDQETLLSAFGRSPTAARLEWFGVTRAQFNAWKNKPATRQPVALARLIRYRTGFDLGEILGKEWDGFRAHGSALEFPGLNRALNTQELRSLWFHIQQVEFWRHRAERIEREARRREAESDTGPQLNPCITFPKTKTAL